MVSVLLRNQETHLYYSGDGRWVPQPSYALSFRTIDDALLFNRQNHLQKMEVVIQHSDVSRRVVLPIDGGHWSSKRWNGF